MLKTDNRKSKMGGIMFCPECGEKNSDDARLCTQCGSLISPPDVPATDARGDRSTSGCPRRRLVLGIVFGILALIIVALIVFLAKSWFSARQANKDRSASNASLSGQGSTVSSNGASSADTASSSDDTVYFYSTVGGGVCRADPKDTASVELIYPVDNSSYRVPSLVWDASGGRVFFVLENYMDEGSCSEVHSIAPDGSTDEVVYVGEPRGSGSNASLIQQIKVSNDTLYLLVTRSSETAGSSFDVIAMDPDGSNQRQLCHASEQVAAGAIVTPEKVYYIDNHYGEEDGGSPGTVYALDYDSSSAEVAYQSGEGQIVDIVMGGDNLYVREVAEQGNGERIVAVPLDGSDAMPIYMSSGYTGMRLFTADEKGVYFELYEVSPNMPDPVDWDLVFVSADGTDVHVLAEDLTIYNPRLNNMGGHFIISENGQDIASGGERVFIMDGDSTSLVEYQLNRQGSAQ